MAYRSQFGDTTFTKVFVGGLAWETETEEMQRYFDQFGDILEAVIITDKHTGKSKGYGFVTFCDPDTARRACADPNPVISGRRANCNIASFGRQRHSPPRGRHFGGHDNNHFQRRTPPPGSSASTRAPPQLPQTLPYPPPVIYPSYGYPAYTTDYWYQQQQQQSQQYYHELNTTSSGGYPFQAPGGMYGAPQAHRMGGSSYLYYPTHLGSFAAYPSPSFPHQPALGQPFPSTTDGQTQHDSNTREGEVGAESDISSTETNPNA